jgi:hypothetical protein
MTPSWFRRAGADAVTVVTAVRRRLTFLRPWRHLAFVEANRSWIDRVMGLVVLVTVTGGVVAVMAVTWSVISNHAVVLVALVVLVPLFLWGLTQDD